ncbi:uncharacterized protein LOC131940413 [Physella acuta]|uniref:uncharacterized protein LOC131940413 n=1 Tax=Physella acuta TaxID=109671 RepID=UPI0027DBA142|nr:uncharacterized protein LOC131940413 [Physella acuta]
MVFLAVCAFLLALAAPSFQQPGYVDGLVGNINQGNCYDRCYSAYQVNPNRYLVTGCNCVQYDFTQGPIGGPVKGQPIREGHCGYLSATCRANPGDYNTVVRFTFDYQLQNCVKVSVYSSCSYQVGVSSNIFPSQQECLRTCQAIKGGY